MKTIFSIILCLYFPYTAVASDSILNFLPAIISHNAIPAKDNLTPKVGVWEGAGQQVGASWTIRIDIKKNEQLIEYPSLNCGGFLTLLENSETRLLFKETITFGRHSCVDQGFVALVDRTATELTYLYYWPHPTEESSEFILGATGTVTKAN